MFIILSGYYYDDNIVGEHTENWTFLSLTEQVIYNGGVHDSRMSA